MSECEEQIADFRRKYINASIPELGRRKTLKEIIGWALAVVHYLRPTRVTWKAPESVGQFELTFGGEALTPHKDHGNVRAFMPTHIDSLTIGLENILCRANLSLWLMIDRLDELFARRSGTEQKALRGLLQTLRLFRSDRIRVKVFLRDDILEQIVADRGFTALSHVAARRSDTLRWSEEQILTMVVRRIFSSPPLRARFAVDDRLLTSNVEYQRRLFYKIVPDTVHNPPNQSPTLRWIYSHTKDGRGVVTPRDVILLLTRACQWQRDALRRDPEGEIERLLSGAAIRYGLEELSKEKRTVYLQAEFPHKWSDIGKLLGGGTEYSETAMRRLFGRKYSQAVEDLLSLGILERSMRIGAPTFKVPFLYRHGLECTQKFISA